MADIFSDVVNFVGSTLKQTITPDNVKDYSHASKLFVGDQYRLVPKNGFLFHVFIDLNVPLADPANPNSNREIGLMVKSADLPKFTAETKTYNAYNRANIVQSKVKYDPVTIIFHDDSSNLIRNFWVSYFKHYYRDSDYTLNQYGLPYKYSPQSVTSFGFSPQQATPFIKCIRLYSLHQKRFSEYILINPIIRSFRHGNHAQDKIDTMQHEMVVEYESVLYNGGRTTIGNPKGFAELHYDLSPSPITPNGGGPRSIFGPGGLIDTGKDVLEDISTGNYGLALFKAARGINNARGMDLKKTAISEITDQFNKSIKESITSQRIVVPNILGTSSIANAPFNGIAVNNAVAALAGIAALRETRVPSPLSTQRINDIRQSTIGSYPEQITNYTRPFPPNDNVVTVPVSAPSSLVLLNDQNVRDKVTVQGKVNNGIDVQSLDNKVESLTSTISDLTKDLAMSRSQVSNTTAALSLLNAKLNAAIALPITNPNRDLLIDSAQQSIIQQEQIRNNATQEVTEKSAKLQALTQELQAVRAERDAAR